MQPLVVLDNFSYAYPGAGEFVLRDISLQIFSGQCVLLQGPIGCGKTTLLMALRGLLPVGRTRGTIQVYGGRRTTGKTCGLVLQRPGTQLLSATLGADIAFGLENLCIAPEKMAPLVRGALAQVGLDRPLASPVEQLSMGQQYRACVAGQLVREPEIILLDEPMAQLDPIGQKQLLEIISQLREQGKAVLICEHQEAMLAKVIDAHWQMGAEGGVTCASPFMKRVERDKARTVLARSGLSSTKSGGHERQVVLKLSDVRLFASAEQQQPALNLEIASGERLLVVGPNGSGKTTLMRCLAGLAQPASGDIHLFGVVVSLRSLRGRLAMLYQDPKKQLFETTVFDEVAFSGRRRSLEGKVLEDRVVFLLEALGIAHLQQRSPHLLSYGQKHLVGLAAVLAGEPEILLLDDPFAGLDAGSIERVKLLITRECEARNLAVVWTAHDPAVLDNWADQVCFLQGAAAKKQEPREKNGLTLQRPGDFPWQEGDRAKPLFSSGYLLALCTLLSCAAFAARNPGVLAGLSAVNLGLIFILAASPWRLLKKSCVFFLWQGILVVLLYMLRFGIGQGAQAGALMAWQLFLAFWPGLIFMACSNPRETARVMGKFLTPRLAFVFTVCLRFIPMLLSEMREIREIQVLRGARLLIQDLLHPRYWSDWLNCLLLPTLVRTLALADEIALAAKNREFGLYSKRTYWPGE